MVNKVKNDKLIRTTFRTPCTYVQCTHQGKADTSRGHTVLSGTSYRLGNYCLCCTYIRFCNSPSFTSLPDLTIRKLSNSQYWEGEALYILQENALALSFSRRQRHGGQCKRLAAGRNGISRRDKVNNLLHSRHAYHTWVWGATCTHSSRNCLRNRYHKKGVYRYILWTGALMGQE